jgi:hypothetical protein
MWISHQLLSPELFQVSKAPAMMHFSWTCIVIIPHAFWIMLICLPSSETLGHKRLHAEFQYKTSDILSTVTYKKIQFLSQVLAQRWMTTVVNLMDDERWIWIICEKCVCVCVRARGMVYHLKQTILLSHLCTTTTKHILFLTLHLQTLWLSSHHNCIHTPHYELANIATIIAVNTTLPHTTNTPDILYHEWQSRYKRLHSTFWTQKRHIPLNICASLTD